MIPFSILPVGQSIYMADHNSGILLHDMESHRKTVIFKYEGETYVTPHGLCHVGNDLVFSDLKSRSIHDDTRWYYNKVK